MVLSSLVAPSYPEGWKVRWHAQPGAGVDGYAPRLEKPALDTSGVQFVSAGGARPVKLFHRATWSVDIDEQGEPHARVLITHEVRPATDTQGATLHWKSASANPGDPPAANAPPVGVMHELPEPIVLTDAQGRPFDLAERGWAVFRKEPRRIIDANTGEERLELVPKREVFVGHSLLSSEGLFWCSRAWKELPRVRAAGRRAAGDAGDRRRRAVGHDRRRAQGLDALCAQQPAHAVDGLPGDHEFSRRRRWVCRAAAVGRGDLLASGRSPLAGIAAVFAGVAQASTPTSSSPASNR